MLMTDRSEMSGSEWLRRAWMMRAAEKQWWVEGAISRHDRQVGVLDQTDWAALRAARCIAATFGVEVADNTAARDGP